MTEFDISVRTTLERDMSVLHKLRAGMRLQGAPPDDIAESTDQINAKLDIWPCGVERPQISLERAKDIARSAIKNANQDTVEIEAVVL